MRVFSFYCCCGDFNYKELTLFCIGESVTSIVFLQGFESIFKSALDMVKQTNDLTNAAEQEEMKFALGNSDNIADLMVAQRKANLSLQYTVAIRNAVMGAYREIMNLQF